MLVSSPALPIAIISAPSATTSMPKAIAAAQSFSDNEGPFVKLVDGYSTPNSYTLKAACSDFAIPRTPELPSETAFNSSFAMLTISSSKILSATP